MPQSTSSAAKATDIGALQAVASRWLMSVHAVWDPRIEASQVDNNMLRLTFLDWSSQRHSVVMSMGGDVVSYTGPNAAGPIENMLLHSPKSPSEVVKPPAFETHAEPPAMSETTTFQYVPSVETPRERGVTEGQSNAPEARVLDWIKDSIGLSSVSIIERNAKGDSIQYKILDEKGGNYMVIADFNGNVQRFDPVSRPRPAAMRQGPPKRENAAAAPTVPAAVKPGSQASLPGSDTTRLESLAKSWLSDNIGLESVDVRETFWDGARLRLDVADMAGNRYRLFVRPSGKVEEFKPM